MLEVTHENKTVVKVEGGECKQGKDYAQKELTDPRRMVTTTVEIQRGIHPLLPVYTAAPFPKSLIVELLKTLRQIRVCAPVQMGQIVLQDALSTGIDIIASRDM